MRFRAVAALLAALAMGPIALAQAPEGDVAVYTNACFVQPAGEGRGQALQVIRAPGGFRFVFEDLRGYPPADAVGQIDGGKLTFETKVNALPIRFVGTITPQEINGRLSNDENDSRYNMEVRWPRLPPKTLVPECK